MNPRGVPETGEQIEGANRDGRRLYREIQIIRFRAKTLLSIYFLGFLFTTFPIALLAGIAAAGGANTLRVDNLPVYGWRAIVDVIIGFPILALGFALSALFLTWPGLWLLAKFKKTNIAFYVESTYEKPRSGI